MSRTLTPAERERLARYRHLESLAARSAALSKTPETRDAYDAIAKAWMNLAAEIERAAEHDSDDDAVHEFMPVPAPQQNERTTTRRPNK